MYVFLDTEFTPSRNGRRPTLLSVGLCAMSNDEFYGEVLLEGRSLRANKFVRAHVLPQLGNARTGPLDIVELGTNVVAWVEGLRVRQVDVCYDHHVDFELFGHLMASSVNRLSTVVCANHIGYLNQDEEGEAAAHQCLAALERRRGWRQHHALADAMALRARFVAVHGR